MTCNLVLCSSYCALLQAKGNTVVIRSRFEVRNQINKMDFPDNQRSSPDDEEQKNSLAKDGGEDNSSRLRREDGKNADDHLGAQYEVS